MSTDWAAYIDAAHRKIAIAEFHCDQLLRALQDGHLDQGHRPSIAIQAFFEGVVTAVISAIDQIAQAANSALKLRAGRGKESLFDVASPEIEARVPRFKAWREQPIGIDLRRLRTRMVHYSYEKSPDIERNWHVEATGADYTGARDLLSYAVATVAFARELGSLADELHRSLVADDSQANNY